LVHVPLAIRYPAAFPAGERVSNTVSTRRLFHTVLDAADVPTPFTEDDPNGNINDLTLAGTADTKADAEKGLVFAEAIPPLTFVNVLEHRSPDLIPLFKVTHTRRGVYQGAQKLAVVADQVEGFFDVAQDPFETADLADQQAAQVSVLQAELASFVQSAQAARVDDAQAGQISDAMRDNLRALGYLD